MFRFFLKKSMYDGWDNLFTLAGFNAAALAIAAGGLYLLTRIDAPAARIAGVAVLILGGGLWSAVATNALYRIADNKSISLDDLASACVESIVPGLQFSAMACVMIVPIAVALPFYASMGGILGAFLAGLVLWLT
ncbi:MAG: hypothetical protein E4H20_12380, partial [Spirochaetales bacterium]